MGGNCCPGENTEQYDKQLDTLLEDEELAIIKKRGESDSEENQGKRSETEDYIGKGDDYKPPEQDNETLLNAFEEAIISRDFDNAMALYEEYEGVDFLSHKFSNGDRAIHYAVREKNARFVYYLLQKGADPNVESKLSGDMPLHIAVRNEDCRMITILLKWKADFNTVNGMDQTPKDIAMKSGSEDIIEMFDEAFTSFLHSKDPTIHDYAAKVRSDVKKNVGAKANIKSAFGNRDDMEDDESKDIVTDKQKIRGKKKKERKMWKPKSMRDEDDEDEYESGEYSSESDYSTDEETKKKSKIAQLMGEDTEKMGDENNVDDILSSLGINPVGHSTLTSTTTMRPQSKKKKKNKQAKTSQTLKTRPAFLGVAQSNPVAQTKKPQLKKRKSAMAVNAISKVSKSKERLPVLGSWLEKKRYKKPRQWQKRYLCVVDGHLLWNEKKITIKPHTKLDATERKKYSGNLSLMIVKKITPIDGKSGSFKFEIEAPNAKVTKRVDYRTYTWKCKSRQLRDDWVKGIKKHCKHLQNELDQFNALY